MAGILDTMRGNANSWFNGRKKRPEEMTPEELALLEQSQPETGINRVARNFNSLMGLDSPPEVPRIQAQTGLSQAQTEETARAIDAARLRTTGETARGLLAPPETIAPTSPLMQVFSPSNPNTIMANPDAVPQQEVPRTIAPAPTVMEAPGQVPVQVDQTPVGAVASVPVTTPDQQTPEQKNWINTVWAKMGVKDDDQRQAIASAMIRGGAAMLGHTSDAGSFASALGAGLTAGANGFDKTRETQKQDRIDQFKLRQANEKEQAQAEIAKIVGSNPNWASDPMLRARVAQLQAMAGDLSAVNKMANGEQTADMREYEFYVRQEQDANRSPMSFGDWQTKRGTGSTRVPDLQKNLNRINEERAARGEQPLTMEEYARQQNQVASDGAFSEKSGKNNADLFKAITDDGFNASSDIANIGVMEKALQNSPGGITNLITAQANQWGLGDLVSKNASSVQLAEAMINKLVPQQRPAGSGAMSDADLELFKRSLPQLQGTREGNQMIVDTMRALAKHKQAMGVIAQRATSGEITQAQALQEMRDLPKVSFAGLPTANTPNAGNGGPRNEEKILQDRNGRPYKYVNGKPVYIK